MTSKTKVTENVVKALRDKCEHKNVQYLPGRKVWCKTCGALAQIRSVEMGNGDVEFDWTLPQGPVVVNVTTEMLMEMARNSMKSAEEESQMAVAVEIRKV